MNEKGQNPNAAVEPLEKRIEKACRGLSYMSETDAPVEPFFGGKASALSREEIIKATGSNTDSRIEETDPNLFFKRLTAIEDWYTPGQKKNASRFATLERLLRNELSDLSVFRIGRIRVAIYVAGLDKNGNILGVKTTAVET